MGKMMTPCRHTLSFLAFFEASLIACFGAFCFLLFFWYLDAYCIRAQISVISAWLNLHYALVPVDVPVLPHHPVPGRTSPE